MLSYTWLFLKSTAGAIALAILGAVVQAEVEHYLDDKAHQEKLRQEASAEGEHLTAELPPEPTPEPAPEPTPSRASNQTQLDGLVTGRDLAGREADFFYVVTQEFHWKRGGEKEEDILNAAGQVAKIQDYLATTGLQNHLNYPGLIAVGTASCEEDQSILQEEKRKERERRRALTRSEILLQWLRTALPREPQAPDLYLLNLGYYQDDSCGPNRPDAETTGHQRKVAYIAVARMQDGVNLREALSNALEKQRLLVFDPQRYSLWPNFVLENRTHGGNPL